jgi:pimeloyl-ACP methyl ester carboxylesterase
VGNLFTYKRSVIAWHRYGTGPTTVLCLHGYGEDSSRFDFLEGTAGDQYSFYAVDLPFHGRTRWEEKEPFTLEDLNSVCQGILPPGEFLLLGFSLGGRVALSLFEYWASPVKKMVLLAPDGLKVNFWYWLSTQTAMGKSMFRFTMKYPGWFFLLLRLLNGLRLVNASVYKFVGYYIGNPAARELLYNRWVVLRKLRPDLEKIRQLIREHQVPVRLVYGRHDRIILSSVGDKFCKKTGPLCEVSIIPSGHQVLHEKHSEYILKALQD